MSQTRLRCHFQHSLRHCDTICLSEAHNNIKQARQLTFSREKNTSLQRPSMVQRAHSRKDSLLACLLVFCFSFFFFNLDGVFHFIKEALMFSSSISCFDAFVWYVSEGGKLFLAHTNEKPSFDTCGFTLKYNPLLR